jgi:hypothetical protein
MAPESAVFGARLEKCADDVKAMRHEIVGKLKEMMSDEQMKLDDLVSEKKDKP